MAAVTVSNRYITVEGPIKREIANISSVDDLDTFVSQLQRPLFGFFVATSDTNSTGFSVNVSISGRTVTFNNSTLSATAGVLMLWGF